ncbi:uncharacterized protein LOC117182652 [Belonocnema kinseyi]|uniref:uncharacterized protein LOC117182652 n=1 Tax=Belonocnema kinseyi TaxID=2817044 RepID=UPI00143D1AB9|nr:uncharacterized protein LOC117182652 [Belonocnema kinseyi]
MESNSGGSVGVFELSAFVRGSLDSGSQLFSVFSPTSRKYVSEGSTVRDCVPTCSEKEAWSTRTYCCREDGCNSGPTLTSSSITLWGLLAALTLLGHSLRG